MKITLINPPFEEEFSVGSSRSVKYVLNIIPPLGLAYLGAVLENNGFLAEIIDCTIETSLDNLFKKITLSRPEIVGITATTPAFVSAKSIARTIKGLLPETVIVLGGAHLTASPEQVIREECFDIGVIGEAEETIVELSRHIQDKGIKGIGYIKGIIFRQGKDIIKTPARGFIQDLDVIPYPARHLLPSLGKYRPTPASYRKLPLGIVVTSRGCPHQCTFCDRAVFGNTYRIRSAKNVLAEVEELTARYNAREIRFFDDCFALIKERTYEICQGLSKLKRRVPWTCLTTVDSVDLDLLREMKSAGCWQVLFGLESGDKGMLDKLNKNTTLEQNIRAVKLAKKSGLSVRADFIVGTPGETRQSLEKTLEFALKTPLDYAHFNKFVPYPGTRLYSELTGKGHNFKFDKGSSITDNNNFIYIPETLVPEKDYYRNFINYAHQKFYLRPGYILSRFFSLRSWIQLKGQLKGLIAVIFLKKVCKVKHFYS